MIYRISEKGFIIDLSHAGHKTAEDALKFLDQENLEGNVIVSHTGIYEEYEGKKTDVNNKRNLPEEILSEVVRLDGIVGIYALTFGLSSQKDDVSPFVRQVRKALEVFGENAVAIGTDTVYQERGVDAWAKHFEFMAATLARDGMIEPRFPDTPQEFNSPDKLQTIGSLLLKSGLSEHQTQAVTGDNFIRYMRQKL